MDWRNVGERLEATESLDWLARPLHRAVRRVLPRGEVKDALHGVWLGHPLHPLLTDVPIGFWTSAWVLDLVGGRRSQPAADTLVGLGVVSALPTASAGLTDWSELFEPERRAGAVHAFANVAAVALYAASWLDRRRGRRLRGLLLGWAGAGAVTVGGFLGGHLSYRRAAGVNRCVAAPDDARWAEVTLDGTLLADTEQPRLAHLGGAPLAVVDLDGFPTALYARCSHLGGPLDQGVVVDGCVRCPWHGSTFRATDGAVVRGPGRQVSVR